MKLWHAGALCLGLGLNGLFPAVGAWVMPTWLAALMSIAGLLILIFSKGDGVEKIEPVRNKHQQGPNERSDEAAPDQ